MFAGVGVRYLQLLFTYCSICRLIFNFYYGAIVVYYCNNLSNLSNGIQYKEACDVSQSSSVL